MDMDPQERESENGEESSPVSQNDEDMSDGEDSVRDHEDADSCDVNQVRNNIIAEHGDVLAKLKMQVGNLKTSEEFDIRHMERPISFPNMTEMLHLHDRFNSGPFPFSHPAAFLPPISQPQPIDPSSGSSHSSEGSASSQHTWSFEEQFKQVRQLYEINDDPKRKEFLDDLFSYMQKKGTPINRLPIMAKSVLDLYELYNLVIARGGLVDVINKKLWQEIIKGLHLPSSITSAAFTLRTQYMKYLYPYECSKLKLSSPEELQAAIDGNRREGRRSSYGQYDTIQRSNASQFSPINQQQQFARMTSVMSGGLTFPGVGIPNGVHPSHPQPMSQPQNSGPIPGLAPNEMEARMMKYVEMWNKGMRNNATDTTPGNVRSPPGSTTPLNQYEISRMALWNLYNNNQPQLEPQKEALNLADSPPAVTTPSIKREIESNDTNSCKKNKAEGEARKIDMTSSTNIKINTRGNPQNGDCSLVVTMELNGITYQGVLFAMTSQPNGRTSL